MNIFVLHEDPIQAAQWHVDRHVVKMPLECGQMLTNACRFVMSDKEVKAFQKKSGLRLHLPTHISHPCSVWSGHSLSNWLWLQKLSLALLEEHYHRYGLKRTDYYHYLRSLPIPRIEDLGLTEFAQAMPEPLKALKLPSVQAYRQLYIQYKTHLFGWKNRPIPPWIPREKLSSPALKSKAKMGVRIKIREPVSWEHSKSPR